jgi:hypothetical protein
MSLRDKARPFGVVLKKVMLRRSANNLIKTCCLLSWSDIRFKADN